MVQSLEGEDDDLLKPDAVLVTLSLLLSGPRTMSGSDAGAG
jgi:hypothetical protein